jgi:hypothetical protein
MISDLQAIRRVLILKKEKGLIRTEPIMPLWIWIPARGSDPERRGIDAQAVQQDAIPFRIDPLFPGAIDIPLAAPFERKEKGEQKGGQEIRKGPMPDRKKQMGSMRGRRIVRKPEGPVLQD